MPAPAPTTCRLCGSHALKLRGPIFHPQPTTVAGVSIDLKGMDFQLLACDACGFQFKHPIIPEEKLLACYQQAASSQWKEDPDAFERQFDLIHEMIDYHAPSQESEAPRRVLDVGCFNGALLGYCSEQWRNEEESWQLYGVEPSDLAAKRAQERGVAILGRTLNDVPADIEPFHAIVLIDVIEHIVDPMHMLKRLCSLMKPSGILLIGTGTTDASSWHFQGSRYWYCSMTEHVSFFNRKSIEFAGRALNMRSVSHLQLSHIRAGFWRKTRKAVRNFAFEMARRARGFGIPSLNVSLQSRHAPWWETASDHMLHVMHAGDSNR